MKSSIVKFLLCLSALLMVSGCLSWPKLLKSPPEVTTLNPPDASMVSCDPLHTPKEGDDLGELAAKWGGQYAVCQLKHDILVWYVKEKQAQRGKD